MIPLFTLKRKRKQPVATEYRPWEDTSNQERLSEQTPILCWTDSDFREETSSGPQTRRLSCAKEGSSIWGFITLQICSCAGLVAGFLGLGVAGSRQNLTSPAGWTAPLRILGLNGIVPQNPWEMWSLPNTRTQGHGGALGMLQTQVGNPKLSNWGAEEWIP